MLDGRLLWTPPGVRVTQQFNPGYNVETGSQIQAHVFHFHDKESGRRSRCTVLKDDSMSQAQVEDMAASAFEEWLGKIREEGRKRPPTPFEKKQIGHAIEEFRQYAMKRTESTNNKRYYSGSR